MKTRILAFKSSFKLTTSFLLFSLLLTVTSCDLFEKDSMPDPDPDGDGTTSDLDYFLGLTGNENVSEVPTTPNFGFGNGSNLPSAVDLVPKFPPIGSQGNYGTCVAWATAYNLKTAISGMARDLTPSQLGSSSNQYSPKDLYLAIPDNQKSGCSGTSFTAALDILQNRGVATMTTAPYTGLGDCSSFNSDPSWANEASGNKIQYWRRIDPTISSIKQNLANNIPIIMGAKLADNFMSWNSNAVLTSGTSFNNVGQHAYHAMVIAGYDDNKGPNGAFKVINSWGDYWGDDGYIWVDYYYMINEFCPNFNGGKPLFIASDAEGSITPPDDDPNPTTNGVDLAPWVFSDFSTYQSSGIPTERRIDMNIYNIGTQDANPSANWTFYYIYFNAYNANDYGVIFYDGFNTLVAPNSIDCPTDYNCNFNFTIPAGGSFTQTVWGLESQNRTYYMPNITGEYYLVMIADGDDVFAEQDELNNLFYTTPYPIYFTNGFGLRPDNANENVTDGEAYSFANQTRVSDTALKGSGFNTIVNEDFKNAYTPGEIRTFIKSEALNGNLDAKIAEYIQQSTAFPYGN